MQKISTLLFISLLLISYNMHAQFVGVGTSTPQKNLSVFGGLNIDQENVHGPNFGPNSLSFGSNSKVGIASSRAQDNLMLFTNNLERFRIQNDGKIAINWPTGFNDNRDTQMFNINHTGNYQAYSYSSDQHAFMIADNQDVPNEAYDGSYLYMGTNRASNLSYIQAERNNFGQNIGNTLMLQYRGNATIGLITSPTEKLEVLGNVKLRPNNSLSDVESGDVIVRGGKGIIRNSDETQLLKQVKTVTVNQSFAAGETHFYDFTWPEPYTDIPEAYVGNIVSGTGGWAEVVMTVAVVSNTGGRLYVYNPTGTRTPNFTVNILAFGAKD